MSAYHALLSDVTFHRALETLDQQLAAKVQPEGCPCGGTLHHADYPRKPRGVAAHLREHHERRISFCCDQDGCRRRRTPASVRFLGRRVYLFAVVLLASVLNHGVTERRLAQLEGVLDISEESLCRWRRWWQRVFPATAVWQEIRGRFVPAFEPTALPGVLLKRSRIRDGARRVLKLLEVLSPLSVGAHAGLC